MILYLYSYDKITTTCANEAKMSFILMFDNTNFPLTTCMDIVFLISAHKMINLETREILHV